MAEHKVVSKSGRVMFEGPEKEARKFVENNYPRPHSSGYNEDVVADAKLIGPDDKLDAEGDTYHADEGWASENEEAEPNEYVEDQELLHQSEVPAESEQTTVEG